MDRIAVMGCGWLGLPLAEVLITKDFRVNGSTTSEEKLASLSERHIEPFLVQLNSVTDADSLADFLAADLLIINVPPGRNSAVADTYVRKMEVLAQAVQSSPIQQVIFVSSTSVYAENNGVVDEHAIINRQPAVARRMFDAEEVFRNLPNMATTVVRMAGLVGPNRHPGRFFVNKENSPNGLSPVNLIHLEDCLGIIMHIIEHQVWNETLNACSPVHPSKMDFYGLATQLRYGKRASFIAEKKSYKMVSAEKLINKFGYQFKYPDLMEWLRQAQ